MKISMPLAAMVLLFASFLRAAPQAAPAPSQSSAGGDEILARVNGIPVTRSMIEKPLIEGYGLNILLNLVQLELAKQNAAKANIAVTAQDIDTEREQTIERMFKDANAKMEEKIQAALEKKNNAEADRVREQIRTDNAQAFEQFLQNQHISRAEFDIVVQTNAYLRKTAEPMLNGKITDDQLKEAFNSLYGETMQCRHIQLANLQEVQEAKRRLGAGEPFAKVALDMSRNSATRERGGELPVFSMQMTGLPQVFRDTAFKLKEGEISDPVEMEGAYHIIQLEKRIPPKAVKFEDVKESLRLDLQDRALQATVKQLHGDLADQALKGLKIEDPVLRQQFHDRMDKRQAEIRGREGTIKQIQREHDRAGPTTAPDLLPGAAAPAAAKP